jgi:membrane fusion protein, multidrug efflux system
MDADVTTRDAAAEQSDSTRIYSRVVKYGALAGLLLIVAAGGWWYYRSHVQSSTSTQAMPGQRQGRRGQFANTVGTAVAQRQDIPLTLDALGTVTPVATAIVRPQVSGVLTQVMYKEGQLVKRGQPLAQIDPASFKLALAQASGNLQRDMAQLEVAKVTLKRDQTLLTQDSIAQQDVDTEAATVKQLEGTVATDQATMATAKLNLGYSTITAPINGRVGLRPVDVGNYVTPADSNGVATLTQLTPIDVVFAIPSDAIARVQSHAVAGDKLPATALDRTRITVLDQGTFMTLDNAVDTQTSTVRAKARFNNDKGVLFPNQFVNVRLLTDTLKNALVVPSAAIHQGPQGNYVYVVHDDSTVHAQSVTTGPAAGDSISIASGLEVGAIVVTEGGDRLTDGATVSLGGRNQTGPGNKNRQRNGNKRQGLKNGSSDNGSAAPRQGNGQRRRNRQDDAS